MQRVNITMLWVALFALVSQGCATPSRVANDYNSIVREGPSRARTSQRTLVLFLVDGMGLETTKRVLRAGKMPGLKRFFQTDTNPVRVGRAVFPTLTYPNISSILTSQNIDGHPVIGNKIRVNGDVVSFESLSGRGVLDESLRGQSVFSQFARERRASLSFASFFGDRADAKLPDDILSGLAYAEHRYGYIDEKIINSAVRTLSLTESGSWPEFVFVHLIGIDGVSHRFGPRAPQVDAYAAELDRALAPLFAQLEQGIQEGRQVSAMLTADHGFQTVSRRVEAQAWVERNLPGTQVINQDRFLALHFSGESVNPAKLATLSRAPGVAMSALRAGNALRIFSAGREYSVRYHATSACGEEAPYALSIESGPVLCPQEIDSRYPKFFYPYFATRLASYFHASEHPDAIVMASEGVTFGAHSPGQHGGFTAEETFVPVFARGIAPPALQDRALPTFALLREFRANGARPMQEVSIVAQKPASGQSESALRARHTLEFELPFRAWGITASERNQSGPPTETGFGSKPSAGFSAEWHQYWSELMSSSLSYGFGFSDFASSRTDVSGLQGGQAATSSGLKFAQHLGVSGGYRLDSDRKLTLSGGASEEFFPLAGGANIGAEAALEKLWVSNLTLSLRNRLVAFWVGDFYLNGGLSLLFPRKTGAIEVEHGFKQTIGVEFERAIRTVDSFAVSVELEHVTQNTSVQAKSEVGLEIAFKYELSFIR